MAFLCGKPLSKFGFMQSQLRFITPCRHVRIFRLYCLIQDNLECRRIQPLAAKDLDQYKKCIWNPLECSVQYPKSSNPIQDSRCEIQNKGNPYEYHTCTWGLCLISLLLQSRGGGEGRGIGLTVRDWRIIGGN